MNPFGSPTVCRDFLVATKAKTALRLPRERRVAVAAALLQLGMPFDERTGHDEPFENILRHGDAVHREDQSAHDRQFCTETSGQYRSSRAQ